MCISQNDSQSDVGVSPGYINSQYANFQYSSTHHPSHTLAEEPDTEYIAIVVVVVIFVVLFVSVNLVLDFFGVWFWVAFAAAFINLLLCMWLMCGPGCKDPLACVQGSQQTHPAVILTSPTSLGGAFQRRESFGRRSEEGGSLRVSSEEIGEEGRTASPPPALTTTPASSPSPTYCDPLEVQFEAPPSYEEALSMKAQEEVKFFEHK